MLLLFSGTGAGFLTTALYSSLFSYFNEKINLVMGVCQIIPIIGLFLTPYGIELFMSSFGFRKTLIGLTLVSLLIFMNAIALEPVEKYMTKVYTDEESNNMSKFDKYCRIYVVSSYNYEI